MLATAQQQNLSIRLLRVLRYNKVRYERALSLLSDDKRDLLHVLPFLLHVNHPELPGYVDSEDTPHGLNVYSYRNHLRDALPRMFPEQKALFDDIKSIWPRQRQIEALLLMGSVGSIAQTATSDFDFWVCVDRHQLSSEQWFALNDKCQRIERWAEEQGMEVHFFVSDIEQVRHNQFGDADGESSGSAQARFLKAEFYATNILVAGRLPFWWLMPAEADDESYAISYDGLMVGQSPEPHLVVDLGNLTQLDKSELFGAAIWQIVKAMDSPFKSVLKMARLEASLGTIDSQRPLCNRLKAKVHGGELVHGVNEDIDPYALMFDDVIHFYQQQKLADVVPLLQTCLYLKCDCELSHQVPKSEITFKRRILAEYVSEWGWGPEQLQRVDNLAHWSFDDLLVFSRQVHRFLITSYQRISAAIDSQPQSVSQQDMTVIGRKLDAYYSRKPHKVEYLRSVLDKELYCRHVTVKAEMELKSPTGRIWYLCKGDQRRASISQIERKTLQTSEGLVAPLVWAVWNKIIDSRTAYLMDFQTDPVTDTDVKVLIRYLEEQFPPPRVSALPRRDLLSKERVVKVLSVVNFASRRKKGTLDTLDTIVLTNWGELYCYQMDEITNELRTSIEKSRAPCRLFVCSNSHQDQLQKEAERKTGLSLELI